MYISSRVSDKVVLVLRRTRNAGRNSYASPSQRRRLDAASETQQQPSAMSSAYRIPCNNHATMYRSYGAAAQSPSPANCLFTINCPTWNIHTSHAVRSPWYFCPVQYPVFKYTNTNYHTQVFVGRSMDPCYSG